ncbi:MAG TPA: GrpB family protein [Vicinamibacterales bacterium]|nr:GrpB family protein [Vicinamibacterales bacterium]
MNVVPYDPQWVVDFERERERLRSALGDVAVRIDHNGSTAVPGLAAKPIIDIQISVARLQDSRAYAPALERLGYVHMPHADDDRCPFFYRPGEWPHTHHVHVVEAGGEEERRTLAFRDYLRRHPEAAREYAALKRDLAARHDGSTAESRESYAAAKTSFVNRIVQEALRPP